ncbi:CD99 antigen-like protein 2 isoform X2 [Gallus gallus]|uniref:CD99 antigen-like protein 2 isoform X2 n=1 Tax=Gallus gallus TaxID=9031 RepID=UPI001AE64B3F|nr:CD99 antigen-like protein 2 isoform X2 [Gallus gallus]
MSLRTDTRVGANSDSQGRELRQPLPGCQAGSERRSLTPCSARSAPSRPHSAVPRTNLGSASPRPAPPRPAEAAAAPRGRHAAPRAMAVRRLLGLLVAAALLGSGHGDDPGGFNLEDALGPIRPTPKGPKKPAGGTGGRDNGLWDVIRTTTTKRPKTTQAPRKQNPGKNPLDLDLSDALGDWDDARDGRQPGVRPEEGFSDSDLEGIVDDGYSPDKKKGSGGNTDSQDKQVETGTIAGIASALAMALVGAVSSYISYQQKKFCFSIQQGLNAEYVKGENMEAVVSEEPQVKYSVLETQSAEPPKHDGAKV